MDNSIAQAEGEYAATVASIQGGQTRLLTDAVIALAKSIRVQGESNEDIARQDELMKRMRHYDQR